MKLGNWLDPNRVRERLDIGGFVAKAGRVRASPGDAYQGPQSPAPDPNHGELQAMVASLGQGWTLEPGARLALDPGRGALSYPAADFLSLDATTKRGLVAVFAARYLYDKPRVGPISPGRAALQRIVDLLRATSILAERSPQLRADLGAGLWHLAGAEATGASPAPRSVQYLQELLRQGASWLANGPVAPVPEVDPEVARAWRLTKAGLEEALVVEEGLKTAGPPSLSAVHDAAARALRVVEETMWPTFRELLGLDVQAAAPPEPPPPPPPPPPAEEAPANQGDDVSSSCSSGSCSKGSGDQAGGSQAGGKAAGGGGAEGDQASSNATSGGQGAQPGEMNGQGDGPDAGGSRDSLAADATAQAKGEGGDQAGAGRKPEGANDDPASGAAGKPGDTSPGEPGGKGPAQKSEAAGEAAGAEGQRTPAEGDGSPRPGSSSDPLESSAEAKALLERLNEVAPRSEPGSEGRAGQGANAAAAGLQSHGATLDPYQLLKQRRRRASAERGEYARLGRELRVEIDALVGVLEELFPKNDAYGPDGTYVRRGGRFDVKRWIKSELRKEMTGVGLRELNVLKDTPRERDGVAAVAFDTSKSMADNLGQDRLNRLYVLLTSALEILEIPHLSLAFKAEVEVKKDLSECLTPRQHEAALKELTIDGSTNDQAATQVIDRVLKDNPAEVQVAFFISDGDGDEKQRERIDALRARGVKVYLLFVGDLRPNMNQLYGKEWVVTAPNERQLIRELGRRVRRSG